MSKPTNREGGIRRGGGRFEPKNEKRDVTSTSFETGSQSSSINPSTMGPVRILQSKRKPEDEGNLSELRLLTSPSIKSPIPRIATRNADSKLKTEITETIKNDEKSVSPNDSINQSNFSTKLFDDYPCTTFNKGFIDNLLNHSSNFNVVGIIGSQGCGKSTFASMLGGNQPGDMYGEYIFRPSSRDFVERGASQTLSINVYISKNRTIIFDCQAINSGHLIEYTSRIIKRETNKQQQYNLKNAEDEYYNEMEKLLIFLYEICHTIVLCIDWFIDMNIIKEIMKGQLLTQELRSHRKVNLIVAHLRAKSNDFLPREIEKRVKILKGIFDNSKFDIKGGISMKKLGFNIYQQIDPEINYVVFAEIKPRAKNEQEMIFEDIFGRYTIEFADIIDKFRNVLINLPKKEFDIQFLKNNIVTEKDWFQYICQPVWDKILSSDFNTLK